MDEVAKSNAVINEILNGVRNIKECLECRICLENFNEPVTIKCGHKFCRSCIQTVAKEENATCPFCNIKIHKRSIPKEGNELLELCVKRFQKLKKALELDLDEEIDFSKIQPAHKVQNTKESIPDETEKNIFNKPSTSRLETKLNSSVASSVCTKRSSISKSLSQSSRRLSLTKKSQTNKVVKTPTGTKKNAIDKYFPNQSNSVSDHVVQSDEKVSNWLKNITPDSEFSTADNLPKTEIEFPAEDSPVSHVEEHTENSLTARVSTSKPEETNLDSEQINPENEDTNFEEIEKRILETEMKAKFKKSNQSLPEKAVLKTTPSVPAASHSDACDWRRIKRVGKEMQVNTFKSLNVSVEKSTPSLLLDETVPMQFNANSSETRDILKESDTNSSGPVSGVRKTVKKTSSNKSDDLFQNDSPKMVIQEYSTKHNSLDSSNSQREENISVSHIDKKQVNEIIGFSSSNVSTPEKMRNSSVHIPVYAASPLQTMAVDENQIPIDDLPNADPPIKKKLSLKVKLPNSCSKSNLSQPSTPDKVEEARNSSPERPKSRLSLRVQSKDHDLPAIRTSKTPLKEVSPTETCVSNRKTILSSETLTKKNSVINNCIDKSKISQPLTRSLVTFKKVGRFSKKKTISFVYLGSTKPKSISIPHRSNDEQVSNILIKSNVPVNIDYKSVMDNANLSKNNTSSKNAPVPRDIKMLSPEKDSQLKFLTRESPKRIKKHVSTSLMDKSDHSEVPMEIDDNLPHVNIMSTVGKTCSESEEKSKRTSEEIDKVLDEIVNSQPQQLRIGRDRVEIVDKMVIENEESPKPENVKLPGMPSIFDFDCDLLAESRNSSPVAPKVSEMEEDAISISSKESEPRTNPKRSSIISIGSENKSPQRRTKKLGGESNSDSESSDVPKLTSRKKYGKMRIGSSNTSSSLKSSPPKKKRAHFDSSEDEATPILAKWCETEEEPVAKKPRISPSRDYRNTSRDQRKCNLSESSDDDIVADTLVQQKKFAGIQRDPPIDDIISKVKHFRENESVTNKMIDMPSSLLSADLFESDACIPPSIRTPPKRLNEIAIDNFQTKVWTSAKDSDKENLSDMTMLDMKQFVRNKSNISESSDNSNKENNQHIQRHASDPPQKEADNVEKQVDNIEYQTNEIGSSQNEKNMTKNHNPNLYDDLLSESLMNITQEQLALKRIEDDLLGDLSAMPSNKATAGVDSQKFSTPSKKTRDVNTNDDFDTDNIEATPVQKRKHIYNQAARSSSKSHGSVSPNICTNLIPAVTPVRNTKSYPLSHSTPMINISNPEETHRPQKIVLVCSQLQKEQATIAMFTKLFNATYQNTFDSNVTHVIVQTDPKTKAAQKTFKFIQGIALQKHVVSFQWVIDCLKQKEILDPDDEKYEVLDPETFECGSKRSRERTKDLFEEFACYCMDPFNAFSINDFKDILQFNGAKVVPTLAELATHKNKLRIIILESEELSPKKLSLLRKANSVLVSYEWVVDSICQYHILSLNSYLCETTVERALECGFPPEYLVEDESVDEDDSE